MGVNIWFPDKGGDVLSQVCQVLTNLSCTEASRNYHKFVSLLLHFLVYNISDAESN